ncbi:MAG: flagellar biosynthesis anti-sigma factor FlgM [Muricomes sp.]
MGISIDKSIDSVKRHYINQTAQGSTGNKGVSASGKSRQFDEILITSNSRQVEEKKLTEELTKRVLSEVSQPTPEARVAELRQRVSEGTYQVDVDRLAGKILLQRGEQADE